MAIHAYLLFATFFTGTYSSPVNLPTSKPTSPTSTTFFNPVNHGTSSGVKVPPVPPDAVAFQAENRLLKEQLERKDAIIIKQAGKIRGLELKAKDSDDIKTVLVGREMLTGLFNYYIKKLKESGYIKKLTRKEQSQPDKIWKLTLDTYTNETAVKVLLDGLSHVTPKINTDKFSTIAHKLHVFLQHQTHSEIIRDNLDMEFPLPKGALKLSDSILNIVEIVRKAYVLLPEEARILPDLIL